MVCPPVLKRRGVLMAAVAPLIAAASVSAATPTILFVGNSFTHGNNNVGDASTPGDSQTWVYNYNHAAITDENGTSMGGVPGIFKAFTTQAGLSYNVSIEAVSSMDLEYHFENEAGIIGQSKWDNVVLQDLSTNPLPDIAGGDRYDENAGTWNLKQTIQAANPSANLFLYETWSAPTGVTNANTSAKSTYYPTSTTNDATAAAGLAAQQADLQLGTFSTAKQFGFDTSKIARVGDAFTQAIADGYADPTPTNSTVSGVNLWKDDYRHAGVYGSFLSAAVLYAKITGLDPRTVSTTTGAAADLQVSPAIAANLLQVAWEINSQAVPTVQVPLPSTAATFGGSFTAGTKTISGTTNLLSINTTEGTFTNLQGATASGVTSGRTTTSQQINSIGTPAGATQQDKRNTALTGLTVHDGIDNLTGGAFQFTTTPFTANTRFFIVDTDLTSARVGDAATVKLINSAGTVIGAYSLSLLANDFTASLEGDTADALALIKYTVGADTTHQWKLGAASFSLADLGISDPSLVSTATGIQITSTGLDANTVGLYTVPEPAGLLTIAGAMFVPTLRRRTRQPARRGEAQLRS